MFLRRCVVAAAAAFCAIPAQAQDTAKSNDFVSSMSLAKGLREISGLAVASNSSVFAHNDEHAIVYELSVESGEILRAFALGRPTAKGDFEGIAYDDGRIYLVTSGGIVYEAMIGAHRDRVRFNMYDTGIGEYCEVEGLSNGMSVGEFLLVCKESISTNNKNTLQIFRWNVNAREVVKAPWADIEYGKFLTKTEAQNFAPSAIEYDAEADEFWLLSARSQLFVVVDRDGIKKRKYKLPIDHHKQAEGLAVMGKHTLIIADEGKKGKAGTLTVYSGFPD